MNYIVIYDSDTGNSNVEEITDRAKAEARFIELGKENFMHPNIQVNLVDAKDRADLEKGWERWFRHKRHD